VGGKILVVEDHRETRDLFTLALELTDFDVVIANDGQAGLEQACAERPDLILTDIQMPRLNGIAMIKTLRSIPATRDVPIVVVTGYGADQAQEALVAGADRAVVKPLDPHVLLSLVRDLLKKKKGFTSVSASAHS
jgi:CheY-like chemotaxis protein